MANLARSTTSVVLFTLAVTFACARAQTAAPQTRPAQTENTPSGTPVSDGVASPAQTAARDGKATVFIYRPKKLVGSALEPSVFCNGVELGRMDNGRYIVLKLDPGAYKFHMTDKTNGFNLDVGAGEQIFIRFKLETGMWKGMGAIALSNDEDGTKQIKRLKPLGADKIKDRTMVVYDEKEAQTEADKLTTPAAKRTTE